jgi:hypothetical protein
MGVKGRKRVVSPDGTMFPASVLAGELGVATKTVRKAAKAGKIRRGIELEPIEVYSRPDTLSWYKSFRSSPTASGAK